MKRNKRKGIAMVTVVAAMVAGVTACGSSSANADLNGYYSSTQNVSFFSAYPDYTFKQATFGLETIETYADGTYCLTSVDSSFSGTLTFSDDGTHEEVPRGSSATKYYGTYTSAEESGLLTLTLSAPSSVEVTSTYSVGDASYGYLNTKAWTDEMGAVVGGEDGSMTAEEYLQSVAYSEMSVIVDTATDSFDYTVLNAAQ